MITHTYLLTKQGQNYRRDMLRQADNERLARLARPEADRRLLRALLVFAGRRLLAAGLYLLSAAYGVKYDYRSIQPRRA